MATLEQLSTALRNADAAGDVDAARALASEIVKLRQSPQQDKGVIGYLGDVGQSIASGATFNYFDEIAAKGGELLGIGDYESNVKALRDREANISPWISVPGQVAGAVGTTLAALPAAAPAAAALGATRFGAALSKLPQFLKFGALGAGEGAIAGSGAATSGERLQGAGVGAAIGAPVGAVAPSVASAATRFAGGVKNAFAPQSNASADLARAIVRDADDPASLMARANDLAMERPGVATLADVGGENVRGLVERVAQTPGAGRTQVVPALTSRQQSQAARISADLRSLTGTNKTAFQAINDTIAERAEAAKPLYKSAFEVDLTQSQEGVAALQTFAREIETGWGQAIYKSPKLRRTLQTEYGVTDTADMRTLMPIIDAWKKQADDMIGEAMRSGNKNQARVLTAMRDRVVSAVDQANPNYASARKAWESPSKFLDAIERGRDFFSNKVSAEEFAARFRTLPDIEKEAERIGAISSIIARMGNDSAKLGDMTKYLRSPENRAKLAVLMPTPEAAERVLTRLNAEVGMSELTARALGNSATARRLAERQDAENIVGDLVVEAVQAAATGGSGMGLLRRILSAPPKWLRDTLRSRSDKVLADVLTNPGRIDDLPNVLKRAIPRGQLSLPARAGATAGGVTLIDR